MAASVKYQWYLAKYAKFITEKDFNNLDDQEHTEKELDVPCKGKWKVYTGKDKDLILSYLESDHLLITHKNIILESFSLINSRNWLKGVAKRDSLLILNKLKVGNNRRFRIQFDDNDETDGNEHRKQSTDLMQKHFPICDYDAKSSHASNDGEMANIDKMVLDKIQLRKAYSMDVSTENLKEIIMLCLTDTTFPSYVAEVEAVIKNTVK